MCQQFEASVLAKDWAIRVVSLRFWDARLRNRRVQVRYLPQKVQPFWLLPPHGPDGSDEDNALFAPIVTRLYMTWPSPYNGKT